MFIYYFVYIEEPFQAVEPIVVSYVGMLAQIADESYRAGEAVPVDGAPHALAKTVQMQAGAPHRGAMETTVPLIWEATGPSVLFPRMDADLVIARVGPALTQLSMRGTYTPPLGRLGRTLDRAVMHRIAEGVVKRFVDRIAGGAHEALRRGRSVSHGGRQS